jgi:hypothetical protein
MEAERLIEAGRRALAASRGAMNVMAEAWQAQALARTVGARLVQSGPMELRSDARGLSEIGGRGCSALDHPMVLATGTRASQLTEVSDVRGALTALATLLAEVGIALVGVACDTGEEPLYWQCIEAIDAADESLDRVHGMLRRLAERERDGPYDAIHGPAGFAAGQV